MSASVTRGLKPHRVATLVAGGLPLLGFLACGNVRSLGSTTLDAGNDAARGQDLADGASDVTLHDAAPLPDALRDVAADARRVPLDAGNDATADTNSDASSDARSSDTSGDVQVDAPHADAFVPVDAGHDGAAWPPDGYFVGPPDAEWLVDAAVDASSCATIAAALCARLAACPQRGTQPTLCARVSPETICFDSYADCVGIFTACVPTATPPASELTLIPDPIDCAAALESDNCTQQGEDYDYLMPPSCAVCPPPWQGPNLCAFNTGDAG
jgi:hypothetical protein